MRGVDSQRYWDERARENALWFVDTQLDRDDPDLDAFWEHGESVVERMLAMVGLDVGRDEDVLDIGCGVGRLTRALARRARHVYGFDVSGEMLRRARELNPALDNVTWVHGDGRSLAAIGDASVDGCFSHVTFQHIPDPAVSLAYIREMGRVLRPGGWTLFQVSTDPAIHRDPAGLRKRLKALVKGGDDERAWWGSSLDGPEMRAAAAAGGLDVEAVLDEGTQYTTVYARRGV